MFRSHRKSDRRVHLVGIAALLILSGGCATTDTDKSAKNKQCPPGRALICTKRMGKTEQCVCEREEKFEDIFESSTGR